MKINVRSDRASAKEMAKFSVKQIAAAVAAGCLIRFTLLEQAFMVVMQRHIFGLVEGGGAADKHHSFLSLSLRIDLLSFHRRTRGGRKF